MGLITYVHDPNIQISVQIPLMNTGSVLDHENANDCETDQA